MTVMSLSPMSGALRSLKKSLDQPKDEFVRDSVIQRFEYSFEICWKTLKRYFEIRFEDNLLGFVGAVPIPVRHGWYLANRADLDKTRIPDGFEVAIKTSIW